MLTSPKFRLERNFEDSRHIQAGPNGGGKGSCIPKGPEAWLGSPRRLGRDQVRRAERLLLELNSARSGAQRDGRVNEAREWGHKPPGTICTPRNFIPKQPFF